MESWKPVVGFPNYQVSNLGHIKSLNYNKSKKEKILSGAKQQSGHWIVCLSNKGKHVNKYIHRLVADAFLEPIPGKTEVDHINSKDLDDNSVDNLRWADRGDQIKNRIMPIPRSTCEPFIHKVGNKYYVRYKTYPCMSFDDLDEAVFIRDSLLDGDASHE